MKTLHLTLVAALVAGCHFDKLFNSAPGGSHAPPPGSGSIRLAFTAQPTDAMKDSIIKPPVQVTVFDSVGNVVTSFAGDVTLAIGNDPGVLKARLSGRSQAAASAGVATFGDLSINQLGNGYTLIATIEAGTITRTSRASRSPSCRGRRLSSRSRCHRVTRGRGPRSSRPFRSRRTTRSVTRRPTSAAPSSSRLDTTGACSSPVRCPGAGLSLP